MTDYDEEFPSPERFVDDIHAAAEQGGEGVLHDTLAETSMALDDYEYQLSEVVVALDSVADDNDLPDPVLDQIRESQQKAIACGKWVREAQNVLADRREEVRDR